MKKEMKEKILELEKKLKEVCETYEDDCSQCPLKKECDEYVHLPIR